MGRDRPSRDATGGAMLDRMRIIDDSGNVVPPSSLEQQQAFAGSCRWRIGLVRYAGDFVSTVLRLGLLFDECDLDKPFETLVSRNGRERYIRHKNLRRAMEFHRRYARRFPIVPTGRCPECGDWLHECGLCERCDDES